MLLRVERAEPGKGAGGALELLGELELLRELELLALKELPLHDGVFRLRGGCDGVLRRLLVPRPGLRPDVQAGLVEGGQNVLVFDTIQPCVEGLLLLGRGAEALALLRLVPPIQEAVGLVARQPPTRPEYRRGEDQQRKFHAGNLATRDGKVNPQMLE